MAGALTASIAAAFAGSAPYFNLTTLLLSTTATNGQQNNTFQDSSTNNFTITRNPATGPNAPTQGTFSPFSQTGWSNYFDGAGDFINTPATGQFAPAGDFTIRFYFYLTSLAATNHLVGNYSAAATTDWLLEVTTGGVLQVFTNGSTLRLSQSGITANRWYYVTVTRTGTTITGQLDGTNFNTTATYTQSGTFGTATKSIYLGMRTGSTNPLTGYLSNVSLVDGSAIQTVPTAPLTAVTGTKLLTCQSNRFVDNSSSPNTLTIGGNTTVVPFSPFNPTSAWSASTVGGSGYFDGTGDQLTESSSALFSMGTGQFTIEFWVYRTASAFQTLFTSNSGSTSIQMFANTGNTAELWISASQLTSNFGSLALNSWNHVAVVRDGSSNMSAYVNGVRGYTAVRTDNLNNVGIQVGGRGSNYLSGYISGFRWVSGADLYSGTAFTVPTSPPTATPSSGTTVLLLNFTNSGIYDATAKNVLETVGNAQVSTAQSKWSPTSMYFDGTGDYLQSPDSELVEFGSGNFTIETWVRFAALPSSGAYYTLVSKWDNSTQKSYLFYVYNASGTYQLYFTYTTNGSTNINPVATITPSINTWYHYAVSRSGANLRMFIDGTQVGSTYNIATDTIFGGTYQFQVGASTGANTLNGYMQDVRITKGYARYTANFTPPTAAFPVQ